MAELLAGPMLRRTEPGVAWLWFATRGESTISATAYNAGGAPIGRSPAGGQQTARLGDNLHVHLVPLEPDGGTFPEGQVI